VTERIGAKSARRHGVIGHLCKSTDMVGDGAAPKEANRGYDGIVVGAVRRSRRCLRRLSAGEPNNGHHRDRWHPFLCGVVRVVSERIGAVLTAAIGVSFDLEATAIGRESGKIGMAGAAGLPGLTRSSAVPVPAAQRRLSPRRRRQERKLPRRQTVIAVRNRQIDSARLSTSALLFQDHACLVQRGLQMATATTRG